MPCGSSCPICNPPDKRREREADLAAREIESVDA
jgi:hypothetical protein